MSKNSNCEPDGDDDDNNNNDNNNNDNNDNNNNNDNNDEDNEDDGDNKRLLKGCCLKRLTRHVMRVHLGGAWNWTFKAERRHLDPKREYPHDVHGCSSLSSFLNSHLEVYIVRHTHRAGEKRHGQC